MRLLSDFDFSSVNARPLYKKYDKYVHCSHSNGLDVKFYPDFMETRVMIRPCLTCLITLPEPSTIFKIPNPKDNLLKFIVPIFINAYSEKIMKEIFFL